MGRVDGGTVLADEHGKAPPSRPVDVRVQELPLAGDQGRPGVLVEGIVETAPQLGPGDPTGNGVADPGITRVVVVHRPDEVGAVGGRDPAEVGLTRVAVAVNGFEDEDLVGVDRSDGTDEAVVDIEHAVLPVVRSDPIDGWPTTGLVHQVDGDHCTAVGDPACHLGEIPTGVSVEAVEHLVLSLAVGRHGGRHRPYPGRDLVPVPTSFARSLGVNRVENHVQTEGVEVIEEGLEAGEGQLVVDTVVGLEISPRQGQPHHVEALVDDVPELVASEMPTVGRHGVPEVDADHSDGLTCGGADEGIRKAGAEAFGRLGGPYINIGQAGGGHGHGKHRERDQEHERGRMACSPGRVPGGSGWSRLIVHPA